MIVRYPEFEIFYKHLYNKFLAKEYKGKMPGGLRDRSPQLWKYQSPKYRKAKKFRSVELFGKITTIAANYFEQKVRDVRMLKEDTIYNEPYLAALEYLNFYKPENASQWNELQPWEKLDVLHKAFETKYKNEIDLERLRPKGPSKKGDNELELDHSSRPNPAFTKVDSNVRKGSVIEELHFTQAAIRSEIPEIRNNKLNQFGDLIFNDVWIIDGWNKSTQIVFKRQEGASVLPYDLQQLKCEWEELLLKTGKAKIQDYDVFAITNVTSFFRVADDTQIFTFEVKDAKNFHRLAVNQSLDIILPPPSIVSVREKYFQAFMEDPKRIDEDFLSSFFGINLTIITSDMKVALMKKDASAAVNERNKLHFGLGDALKRNPASSQDIGIETYAYDRLRFYYNLVKEEIDQLSFYCINFSSVHCGLAAYGYAKLNITFSELTDPSRYPKRALVAMPFSLEGIINFVTQPHPVPINQYALYGAISCLNFFHDYPMSRVNQAFTGDTWKELSKGMEERELEYTLDDLRREAANENSSG